MSYPDFHELEEQYTRQTDYPLPSARQMARIDFYDSCRQRIWDVREELKAQWREAPLECSLLALCAVLAVVIIGWLVWQCF